MNNNGCKKGGRIIDMILITTIFSLSIFITIFMITSKDYKFQNVSASDNISTTVTSNIIIEELETEFDGIELIRKTNKNIASPYQIQYINTEHGLINEQINQYISESESIYENTIRLQNTINHNSDTNRYNNLKIQVELFEHQKKYISVVFTKSVAIGSNVYDSTIKTIFFNNETGEIIDLRHIIDLNVNHLISLTELVRSEMSSHKVYKNHLDNDQFMASTEPKWKLYKRFAIKNNKIVFYYDKGEIGSRGLGIPTISIPLSSIYSLLAPEYQVGIKDNSVHSKPPTKENNVNGGKKVALTFDDGPHPTITLQILNLLDKYNAKATFFVVGNRVKAYPDIAIETLKRGHEVGNHTWNHASLTKLTSDQVLEQLQSTNQAIKNVTGQYPTVFRPPYGDKNERVLNLIDLPVVMWSIDTLDWKYRDSSNLLPIIKNKMHNNAIILMHDIHQSTANGLEDVLIYLQSEGYEFVTVSELMIDK
nr:polysaccharide deacetylase family protein [Lysinibacillus timonensis]